MSMFTTISKSVLGLTLVAAATGGHALSIASMLHLHQHLATASNTKANLTLVNPNFEFRDVQVNNKVYTIRPHENLVISAPVGTPVFAASGMFRNHAKGALLAQVESGERTLAVD